MIELAERKCEIKGLRHIMKNRLLQLPEGIDLLELQVEIKPQEIESFFERHIRQMVEKEISE